MAKGGGLPQLGVVLSSFGNAERVRAEQARFARESPGFFLMKEVVTPVSWIPWASYCMFSFGISAKRS